MAARAFHYGIAERSRRRLTAGLILCLSVTMLGVLFIPRLWWVFALVTPASMLAFVPQIRGARRTRRSNGKVDPVPRLLDALRPQGCEVITNVRTVIGTIEYILVGPMGIFIIETKPWRGRVRLSKNGRLSRNGRNAQADLRKASRDAIDIKRILTAAGARGWVFPIIVLTEARLPHPVRIDTTTICETQDLMRILESRTQQPLEPDEVTRAATAILRATVPLAVQLP